MTAICPSSILACGMRVTVLDSLGNVVDDPNNFWTSNKLIQVQFTPEVFDPGEKEQISGCNCVIATQKSAPLLKRFTIEIQKGTLEPGLESMMLGSDVILDGVDPIGTWWPNNAECGDTPPPFVALEVWSQTLVGNRQDATFPYVHWIWPMTQWMFGQSVLSTDVKQEVLTGFSIPNSRWGSGPFDDDPGEDVQPQGGYWFTAEAPPAGVCGYQTITPSS